jgi:electron transport complex protein RnfG
VSGARKIIQAGLLLALFALVGTGLVAFVHQQTWERIAENERQALLEKLQRLIPPERIDNDMIEDRIEVRRADLLGANVTRLYRGRLRGEPVAVVLNPVLAQGYGGAMNLLVAVNRDGSLAGVRVIAHKETPGLGDKMDEEKSDWIYGFDGKSRSNPAPEQWQVKRDGGVFDQFTGATITPRAVVAAVKKALDYVHEQGEERLYRPRQVQRPAQAPPAQAKSKETTP